MFFPDYAAFCDLAEKGNLIPVYREIMADMDTPVSAFKKLDNGTFSFLLESIEGGEKWGRYSFLGSNPDVIIRSKGACVEIVSNGAVTSRTVTDPLACIKELLAGYTPVEVEGLPRFFGGAVGYLGYDMVRHFENLPSAKPALLDSYDSYFLITDTILIFDTVRQKIKVVSNAHVTSPSNCEAAYREACSKIDAIIGRLRAPHTHSPCVPAGKGVNFRSNMNREDFELAVEKAKEYVRSGDIIQVVLSQRFSGELTVDPLDIYRVLRTLNPSPYMFFLKLDDTVIAGASPEVMVRKEGRHVELRPIAGTRPRGVDAEADAALADELLADPKECAEHVMLVDLGRNDLGRVCAAGSVSVSELMVIERYSHVMHIVSNVQGELLPDNDSFDLVRATFPAGTLSGAPKMRAMQIIDELEPIKREIYGGAIGYFSFSGNMDLAIAIRTLVIKDGKLHLQAGAGIVADSDPSAEWQETVNKAMAVVRAVETAERGLI
ncbi:MAG: anthranilate synthase component I [Desulfuromonadales bacterium]